MCQQERSDSTVHIFLTILPCCPLSCAPTPAALYPVPLPLLPSILGPYLCPPFMLYPTPCPLCSLNPTPPSCPALPCCPQNPATLPCRALPCCSLNHVPLPCRSVPFRAGCPVRDEPGLRAQVRVEEVGGPGVPLPRKGRKQRTATAHHHTTLSRTGAHQLAGQPHTRQSAGRPASRFT